MKTILLFLSVFFSTAIYSQEITPMELIKIAKMDRESFEIYAMDMGYAYDKIDIKEDVNELWYSKNNGVKFYISHCTKWFDKKFSSGYQVNNVRLLSVWYKHLKNLGFKLSDESEFDGAYVKDYIRGKETISIYIDNWLEIRYDHD